MDTANMFQFRDRAIDRYSMDSAIGLSTMLAIDPEQFTMESNGKHVSLDGVTVDYPRGRSTGENQKRMVSTSSTKKSNKGR
ncbi:MAG TPA: hypothetical protein VMV52_10095 [Candidatus Nanopelagicaceae bacterium]|nr:hypothetical protein [Candidatus Nanopelagicaceae bacterium]